MANSALTSFSSDTGCCNQNNRAPVRVTTQRVLRAAYALIISISVLLLIPQTHAQNSSSRSPSSPSSSRSTSTLVTMPPWTTLEYSASKFFIRMDSSVQLEHLSPEVTQRELLSLPAELKPAASARPALPSLPTDTVKILVKNSVLNRHTESTVWLRPDLSALQRESLRYGEHYRHQIYRYLSDGAYAVTRRPDKKTETDRHWSSWSRQSSRHYQLSSPMPATATEAEVLFLLAMDQQLYTAGHNKELLLFDKDRIVPVMIHTEKQDHLPVRFELYNGKEHQRISEEISTVRASISASGSSSDELDILGFAGKIILYMDPKRQMIVRISGDMEVIGEVNINLKKAYLAPTNPGLK